MPDEQRVEKHLQEIRDERLTELADLDEEISTVYRELVEPRWQTDPRRFSRTLYAYVMATLSFVDLLSTYRYDDDSQTRRMGRFLAEYLGVAQESAALAVKLWRHTLMHTANPQVVRDEASGTRYRWLLHWGAQLPRAQHMTVTRAGHDERILNVAISYLVHDLISAARRLFAEATVSDASRARLIAADASIRSPRFYAETGPASP